MIRFPFNYQKSKVLQALRYHFIWQPEIKIMILVIIVFDIVSAFLYYSGKIQPGPFLLGSVIWLFFIITLWFLLPINIYKKSITFQENYIISFSKTGINLETDRGSTQWLWKEIIKFEESPHFFHLYFSAKSFFLVPKNDIGLELIAAVKGILKENVLK